VPAADTEPPGTGPDATGPGRSPVLPGSPILGGPGRGGAPADDIVGIPVGSVEAGPVVLSTPLTVGTRRGGRGASAITELGASLRGEGFVMDGEVGPPSGAWAFTGATAGAVVGTSAGGFVAGLFPVAGRTDSATGLPSRLVSGCVASATVGATAGAGAGCSPPVFVPLGSGRCDVTGGSIFFDASTGSGELAATSRPGDRRPTTVWASGPSLCQTCCLLAVSSETRAASAASNSSAVRMPSLLRSGLP
jgi:hypothetical protein